MGTLKVYILHGWTYATSENNPLGRWDNFLNELHSFEVRGHLLSVPGLIKDTDRVYTLEDYVSWLDKILQKEKGGVSLIGHSNGGRIATTYAFYHPDKVKHLILIDSAGIFHNELPIRLKRLIFKSLALVGKAFFRSEVLRKFLYRLTREQDYQRASKWQRATMRNLIYLDLREIFKKIKTRTFIIWGEEDKVTPLSDGLKIHQFIKNSRLEIIKKAGHAPQFSHPKEVVSKILKELR